MLCLDIFLTNWLDFTKTIIPLALMASESIAHLAFGLVGIDSEPIRARGIIVNYLGVQASINGVKGVIF